MNKKKYKRILFVDDEANILSGYKRNLHNLFDVATAFSGAKGLEMIKDSLNTEPFAVIVSDFRMPEMDGNTFLSLAREISPDSVRILLTGYADVKTTIDAVNEGNIFRFLNKPCSIDNLTSALNASIEQFNLITMEKELLNKTLKGSIKLLIDVLSLVNPSAFSRAERMRKLASSLADRLGIKSKWEIEIAALLSQIGFVALPPDIIEKKYKGVSLNEKEAKMFLTYPKTGEALLKNIPRLEAVAKGISYQLNEYKGGEGAHSGLQGKDIPIIARLLKVVIDFDYLVFSGQTAKSAFKIMHKSSGKYDPNILRALKSDIAAVKKGFILKDISFDELREGMYLSSNIENTNGIIIVPKGTVISEIILLRLRSYASSGSIVEPIVILSSVNKQ